MFRLTHPKISVDMGHRLKRQHFASSRKHLTTYIVIPEAKQLKYSFCEPQRKFALKSAIKGAVSLLTSAAMEPLNHRVWELQACENASDS